MFNGMLFVGIILGCTAGLLLALRFAGSAPPAESVFLRFFQKENKSMRLGTSVMLHELHHKVETLSAKVQRMDAQMQDLASIAAAAMAQNDAAGAGGLAPEAMENVQDLINAAIARVQDDAAAAGITAAAGVPALMNADPKSESPGSMDRSREISSLLKEGLSSEEIARRLNLGSGEVELILSLGRKPFWVVGSDR